MLERGSEQQQERSRNRGRLVDVIRGIAIRSPDPRASCTCREIVHCQLSSARYAIPCGGIALTSYLDSLWISEMRILQKDFCALPIH